MSRPDVLIVGAGPAGSAAALACRARGLTVVLADRARFPRDKACGDALIPDSLQALGELGVLPRVRREAHAVRAIRIYAPNGRYTTLAGECACLPRAVFDEMLRGAAESAGAEFRSPLRAVAPLEDRGVVSGVRFERLDTRETVDVRAGLTLLATGAASDVLQRFGMCLRSRPSATAARLYVEVDDDTARAHDYFCIAYARAICPGYGWLFPGPRNTFNVGVGYVYGRYAPRVRNLRNLLDRFVETFEPASALMKGARRIGPLKGAPLRTTLQGARLSRPGLLVIGEAAGLTYDFSGEGIGKAMQSGMLAAQIAASARAAASPAHAAAEAYAAQLPAAFGERLRAYARLQRLVARPAIANLLIARAKPGRYVHRQLQALLDETGRADELLTPLGIARALVN